MTAEEAEAFALSFEEAIVRGDAHAVRTSFDWRGIVEHSDPGGWRSDEERRAWLDGFARGAARKFTEQLIDNAEAGGDFSPLDAWAAGQERRVLFRFLSDEGLNYVEMSLGRVDGAVVVTRVHVYMNGEPLSRTYKRVIASMQPREESAEAWLFGQDVRFRAITTAAQQMTKAIDEGEPERALAILRRLPESFRSDVVFVTLRLKAALQIDDDDTYREAVEATVAAFEGRKEIDLLLIDAHTLRGEYDEALACVDRLDAAIGGDPYLDVMRASLCYEKGDLREALRYAQIAVREAGELLDCHWVLVATQLLMSDHAGVVDSLDRLEQDHGVELNDLRESEEYQEFCGSPEGKRWLADHGFE